ASSGTILSALPKYTSFAGFGSTRAYLKDKTMLYSRGDSVDQRRVKRGWMNLKVTRIVDETHDTKTFYMEDADEGGRPFDFIAGQYLTFRFDAITEKPLVRSYTMSGSPCQTNETI